MALGRELESRWCGESYGLMNSCNLFDRLAVECLLRRKMMNVQLAPDCRGITLNDNEFVWHEFQSQCCPRRDAHTLLSQFQY